MVDLDKLEGDLRFDLLRNAIYHSARARFLDFCTRVFNFAVILLGTSAAADLGKIGNIDQGLLAAGAAIAGIVQLVGDFGVSARTHSYLQRRCYELLAELGSAAPTEESLRAIRAKLTLVYGEEPPPMREGATHG